MSLPSNFAGMPKEELHHHFRNVCLGFKKTVKSTKDINELELALDRFINSSRQMNWHHKGSEVYHKDEGEKTSMKVLTEFQRYIQSIKSDPDSADPKGLLDAISSIERMILNLKVG